MAESPRQLWSLHQRGLHRAGQQFCGQEPGDGRGFGEGCARIGGRCRQRGPGGARRPCGLVATARPPTRQVALCLGADRAETRAVPGGSGDVGQRQDHPRNPRHRRAAGGAAFLPSCRLGRVAGRGIPRSGRRWCLRPDHPVEFPAVDAVVENCAGTGGGQHRGAETGRIHAADRPGLCRDLRRGGSAEGRGEYRHRRRRNRGGTGGGRGRQDRLHRINRSWPPDPQGDRRVGQEADTGTGRQVALHRFRRCRH